MAARRSLLPFLVVLASCSPAERRPAQTPDAGGACVFAADGVCDEPANCPLGTDEADCAAACATTGDTALFAAACAHRLAPEDAGAALSPPAASEVTGFSDHVVQVPSGADARTVYRHFRLYVPPGYEPSSKHPLVIVMPGHRVGIHNQAGYTELTRTAELRNFLVVYAEQEWRWSDLRWAWWTDWDWSRTDVNPDLTFLRKIVEFVGERYAVDRSRVYASGHSRGGALALIAALELPDLFAGACVQSGFTEFGYDARMRARTGRRVPLVFIHGVQDDDVCIDCAPGGRCTLTGRSCGTAAGADTLVNLLADKGWTGDELRYYRLSNVAHRWQPQLNEEWVDFLFSRPHPEVAP